MAGKGARGTRQLYVIDRTNEEWQQVLGAGTSGPLYMIVPLPRSVAPSLPLYGRYF
jgi:hypothetical protein